MMSRSSWCLGVLVAMAAALSGVAGCADMGKSSAAGGVLPIKYHYVYALAVMVRDVEVSPAGALQVKENQTTDLADVKSGQMQLTPEQMQQLNTVFRGWSKLSKTYPLDFNSPTIDISYGGYNVEAGGGDKTAPQFKDAMALLNKLAEEALAKSAAPAATNPALP